MNYNYHPAKAVISGQTLSIAGTVNVAIAGGIAATTSVSGQTMYLPNDGVNNVVRMSGQGMYLVNDGINNIVKMSGQTVQIAGGVNISGQKVYFANDGLNNVVNISGQSVRLPNDGVNNVVVMSGQNVYNYGSTVKTNAMVTCIGTSGGTNLPNITCVKAYIRSMSGNDVMFVGGTGSQAPFSGTGIELYGGEVLPLEISNTNLLNVMAVTANQKVSILTVAQ